MALPPLSSAALPMLPPQSRVDGGMPVGPPRGGIEEATGPSAFQTLFEATVGKTNTALINAESQAHAFAEGKTDDIHGTMIAVSEADIQLRLLGTMKNKIVDAFYELWRMQI